MRGTVAAPPPQPPAGEKRTGGTFVSTRASPLRAESRLRTTAPPVETPCRSPIRRSKKRIAKRRKTLERNRRPTRPMRPLSEKQTGLQWHVSECGPRAWSACTATKRRGRAPSWTNCLCFDRGDAFTRRRSCRGTHARGRTPPIRQDRLRCAGPHADRARWRAARALAISLLICSGCDNTIVYRSAFTPPLFRWNQ